MKFLLIFLGGGLGSVLRFYLSFSLINSNPFGFPWPTFAINLIGSFLLGFLVAFYERELSFSKEMMLLTTTGFCGGFTTFSTFSYENLDLLKSGNTSISLMYIGASVIGGIIAATIGYLIAKT